MVHNKFYRVLKKRLYTSIYVLVSLLLTLNRYLIAGSSFMIYSIKIKVIFHEQLWTSLIISIKRMFKNIRSGSITITDPSTQNLSRVNSKDINTKTTFLVVALVYLLRKLMWYLPYSKVLFLADER